MSGYSIPMALLSDSHRLYIELYNMPIIYIPKVKRLPKRIMYYSRHPPKQISFLPFFKADP